MAAIAVATTSRRAHHRTRTWRKAAALASALLIVAALSGCQTAALPVGTVMPTASLSVTGLPPAATATATTVPVSTPPSNATAATPPTPSTSDPADSVRVNALGSLRGNWVFAAKLIQGSTQGSIEVWAIPLDSGSPRLAFSYPVSTGGIPEAIFDNAPYLRRQFSPDGMRVVVSVYGDLVVVDLASGQSRRLGVSGFYPSWSKDGSRIAFLAHLPVTDVVPPHNAILVVPSGGGVAREIARIGQARRTVEWSADGSLLALELEDAGARHVAIFDVVTGQLLRRIERSPSAGVTHSFAHWRAAQPQLALTAAREDEWTLSVLDTATGSERVVLRKERQPDTSPCRCPQDPLPHDPRWNPVAPQELLYSLDLGDANVPGSTRILDVSTGGEIVLPISARQATWTWSGRQVVYLARGGTWRGVAVRVWDRDRATERDLLSRASDAELFTGIASLDYGR